MKSPKVSIIIPLYVITERFFDDLEKFSKLDYSNYEILVVCDKKVKITTSKARLILTGRKRTGPAEKRDIALKHAKGTICAFIDDDAYPEPDWLRNAIVSFSDDRIAAVGGPGITPKEDGYWEQLTGLVYGSYFCGGAARYRFVKARKKFVDDYPAYNLLIRKNVLKKVGGYGSHFYGGEDTFLCLKIVKAGYKILYDPKVVVYHHRRALFRPYLKQIANIGKHRGYFARVYPQTSRRLMYFLPTVLAIGFWGLPIASLFFPALFVLYLAILLIAVLLVMFSINFKAGYGGSLLVAIGIIMTHVVYGTNFILGYCTRDLKR